MAGETVPGFKVWAEEDESGLTFGEVGLFVREDDLTQATVRHLTAEKAVTLSGQLMAAAFVALGRRMKKGLPP